MLPTPVRVIFFSTFRLPHNNSMINGLPGQQQKIATVWHKIIDYVVCVFMKLHITAQPGPDIVIFLGCYS